VDDRAASCCIAAMRHRRKSATALNSTPREGVTLGCAAAGTQPLELQQLPRMPGILCQK
jgi:hypothetical protein